MRKPALILAAALVLDLGLMAVASQATGKLSPSYLPDAPILRCDIIKADDGFFYVKLDTATSRQTCESNGGKVVTLKGVLTCRIPPQAGARWTPVVPKP